MIREALPKSEKVEKIYSVAQSYLNKQTKSI